LLRFIKFCLQIYGSFRGIDRKFAALTFLYPIFWILNGKYNPKTWEMIFGTKNDFPRQGKQNLALCVSVSRFLRVHERFSEKNARV
jgi:hypothetical protein